MMQKETRTSRVLTWLCLWLPFIGIVGKQIFLQMFIGGSNAYTVSVWEGLGRALPYLPLSAAVLWLFFGWTLLFKRRARLIAAGIVSGVLALVVFIDIAYIRSYNVMPSVIMLPMLEHSTGKSTVVEILPALLTWWDLLLLSDFVVWAVLLVVTAKKKCFAEVRPHRRSVWVSMLAAVLVLVIIPLLGLCGVRQPFRRLYVTPDTLQQSQYFSFMGFHIRDFAEAATGTVTTTSSTPDDEEMLAAYREWQHADSGDGAYFGQFEGKNLLVIQFESLESFVLGNSVNGQEITPTLNRLMGNAYTFPHLYEQVKSGNSADCDFLFMTGLLPTNKGYAFGQYPHNDYLSVQKLLNTHGGYNSYYFHGAVNSIWNYTDMLEDGLGTQHIEMDYAQDDMLNGYLSDESFFRQTAEKLKQNALQEPFYAHVVTCSSHIPCVVPDDFEGLTMSEELAANPMGDYLQAVHYTDRQLGLFLEQAEQSGLLDNTLLVVVGDHGGIHKYYPHWVKTLPEEARLPWFLADDQMYTVPMICWSKDIETPKTVETIGAQMDILPTLLGLLGVQDERAPNVMFGRDLLNTRRNFAVMDNGTVYGTLPEEEAEIARTMYYLSDMLVRSGRVNGG